MTERTKHSHKMVETKVVVEVKLHFEDVHKSDAVSYGCNT